MPIPQGFNFRAIPMLSDGRETDKWKVYVDLLGFEVWWVIVDAVDKYQATGKGAHAFADRLRDVLQTDEQGVA